MVVVAMVLALGMGACIDDDSLSSSSDELISDQEHGGTTGFFFLPPVVPRPGVFGDFVPDVPATVTIDQIDPTTGDVIAPIATYTPGVHLQGAPGEDGDSDPEGYFVVRWRTRDFALSSVATYRIAVRVPGRTLGFADVDLVMSRREFKNVDTTSYTPLIDGETLRIKFRIDRPAVDADGDGVFDWNENATTVGQGGGTVEADGAALDIPAGALPEDTAITVAVSDDPPPAGAVSPLYVFGPDGLQFQEPVTVRLPVPAGATGVSVYWSKLDGAGFDRLGGTIVGDHIEAQVTHFSEGYVAATSGNRTVTVSAAQTYLDGVSSYPDLIEYAPLGDPCVPPEAPVPVFRLPDGSCVLATIAADGRSFSAELPDGEYMVEVQDPVYGRLYYVSSASALDIGADLYGRHDAVVASPGTTLTFSNVGGLESWEPGDQLYGESIGAGVLWFALQDLNPIADATETLDGYSVANQDSDTGHLIDGDTVTFYQRSSDVSPELVPYSHQVRVFETSVAQTDGADTLLTGAFSAGITNTFDLSVDVSAFEDNLGFDGTYYTAVSPAAEPFGGHHVSIDTYWTIPALETDFDVGTTTETLTDLSFATAASDPTEVRTVVAEQYLVPVQLPGSDAPTLAFGDNFAIRDGITTTMTPVVGPFGGLFVNGADAKEPQTAVGVRPTISWTPPTLGSVQHFLVNVMRVWVDESNTTRRQSIAWIETDGTSLTLPAELLVDGESYLVRVSCQVWPDANPLKRVHQHPWGRMRVISNWFSTQ